MRYLFLFILFSLVLAGHVINAQQCISGGCTNGSNQFPSATFTTTSATWSIVNSTMNAGNYTLFSVTAGNTYEWTYCEAYGGISTGWDAQITLLNNADLTKLCFSADFCGTNGNAPYISWYATFTGSVILLTTAYVSGDCKFNTGAPFNKLVWRQSVACTAVSMSTQPQSQTITVGSTATLSVGVNGTSPFLYFWYKNGVQVSGANSSSYTTPTLTISDNGNYYYCIITNCSSTYGVTSNNATLTVNPIAAPIIGVSGNLAFGNWTVGSSSSLQTLTISNTGNATLSVSSISYPAGFTGSYTGNIGAGSSVNVAVYFSPTSATSFGGTVTVNSNATNGTNTISCSGTGIAPAPTISSFSPTSGAEGISVTITGTNFSTTAGNNAVKFNGTTATITGTPTATSITATVPTGATTGAITVTVAGQTATSSTNFTVSDVLAPTVSTYSPLDNATGVATTSNLVLTFSETVQKGTGNILIKESGATTQPLPVTDPSVTISGSTVTIDPPANFSNSALVNIEMPAGVFKDLANNNYAGISNSTTWNFTVAVDVTAPTVSAYSPLDNATGVAANSNLVLTFSENVQKGTGNILIKEGGVITQPISVLDPTVTISGNIVTINPTNNFTSGANVNVVIASGAIKDIANNNYAGITNATSWNFAVVADVAAPTVSTFSPADNATNVTVSTNLVLTFNEDIQKGTGNILIREGSTITQTIAVTDASVTISGSTVAIDPANFAPGAAVNIQMVSGVIKDLSNNNYAGIADATTWNFAVATDATPPSITDGTSTKVNQSEALTITANITDNESAISAATVEFWSIAAGGATTTRALSPTGNTFTTTIAATEIGELGIEYKLSATSAGGTFTSSNFKTVAVNQNNGLVIPYSSFGKELSNYRIVSVPLQLTANSINSVFDELGAYDKKNWRMYRYDNGATTELSGTTPMLPGKGYWLIAKANPGKAINSGVGSTVTTTTTTSYEIDLKADWNQIGNPYNFNLSWDDIVAANPGLALPVTLRVYTDDFIDGTRLNKMEGAFIKVNTAQKLKFPVVKNVSVNGRTSEDASRLENPLVQPDWQVYFKIAQGEVNNLISGFGMNTKATDGFDKFDGFNMPRFFETFLELNHAKKEGADFYSSDIVAPKENHVWEFDIESNAGEDVISLSWDNSYFGKNDRELYLWDVAQQRAIDMKVQNNYALDKRVSKSFRAIYGSGEFVEKETSVDKFVVHSVWPNPADERIVVSFSLPRESNQEVVSFTLVDMLGRKIWNEQKKFNGGYHEVTWQRSAEATNGIFIMKISTRHVAEKARVIFR